MRFACGDMRDHIVSYQNDPRPSYWRRRALRQQARLKIYFSEILPVVRFSTFATISARMRREHLQQTVERLLNQFIGADQDRGRHNFRCKASSRRRVMTMAT